jgi:hypothetical protein
LLGVCAAGEAGDHAAEINVILQRNESAMGYLKNRLIL